ncbi:MAG: hypothetical protein ISS78_08195 [Phycisphaerae bacterium]|nr:hypothetical protein [Phycisphaerae bacterium]
MKNAENITIVMLVATAAILGGMLIGTYSGTSQSAVAEVYARHMGFIVSTGQAAPGIDAMYIIDLETKKLNTYILTSRNNAIEFVATMDLQKAFRAR